MAKVISRHIGAGSDSDRRRVPIEIVSASAVWVDRTPVALL